MTEIQPDPVEVLAAASVPGVAEAPATRVTQQKDPAEPAGAGAAPDAGADVSNADPSADAEADPGVDEDAADDTDPRAGREARKYRRRLREVEADRDAVNGRLTATQRSLVEHLAQGARVRPAALWASGAVLADLLDADGVVDPGKVQAACEHAAETLGLVRAPLPDLMQGFGGGDHGGVPMPSWSELLKQRPV